MQPSTAATPTKPPATAATLADLTAVAKRTSGQNAPPPLVGCSLTLVDDAVYVFGGRLVSQRHMTANLYRLDLTTMEWTQPWDASAHSASSSSLGACPEPRYFHSAEAWGHRLVIFGGEGYAAAAEAQATTDDSAASLATLDDIAVWDTIKNEWLEVPVITCAEGVEPPASRYAHLALVQTVQDPVSGTERSVMVIMGGQDIRNTYLQSVHVLDLDKMQWIRSHTWSKSSGTYRAVLASSKLALRPAAHSSEGDLSSLSSSVAPSNTEPQPMLLFSNFNFTQVRRDVELLPSPFVPSSSQTGSAALPSHSLAPQIATNTALPPGLRFPSGTVVGRHLLVYGTHLSAEQNAFTIWSLDLGEGGLSGLGKLPAVTAGSMKWKRVDPGSVLNEGGSWNRAVVWRHAVVVLGDRERAIAADYEHRQTNFRHVTLIDLESFGIYSPPLEPVKSSLHARLGLRLLQTPALCDFEIRPLEPSERVLVPRQLLEHRWPWFRTQLADYRTRAAGLLAAHAQHGSSIAANAVAAGAATTMTEAPARTLVLPEPAAVVRAFVHYLATRQLPLQPASVWPALLVFAHRYGEHELQGLCMHALHHVLDEVDRGNVRRGSTVGRPSLGQVYEAATLGGCLGLQIRALRALMSAPSRAPSTPR